MWGRHSGQSGKLYNGLTSLDKKEGAKMKKCTTCGEEKALDDFYRRARASDGRQISCKACQKEVRRVRYAKDRDKERARADQWYSRNAAKGSAYMSWREMRRRCDDAKRRNYKNYGGRGITVCERWYSFARFLEDMGERPEGTSLDRIDPNGNYEPGNCRWATAKEQRANQR